MAGRYRRVSNGDQVSRVAALAMKRGKSVYFTGNWQLARYGSTSSQQVVAYSAALIRLERVPVLLRSCVVSWDLKFLEPIPLPGKRKPLVTLRDAVNYMTSLPRSEQNAEHWRPAATLLAIIGEKGGCMFFAERAVAFGMRKGVDPEPPEFDPDRKRDRPWGKRKLKRDE